MLGRRWGVEEENMTSRSRSALRPGLVKSFRPPETEGAGNAGCALHPRSRAQVAQKNARTSIQGSGGSPTSPAQWLYGLLRALPGERAFLPPSSLRSLLLKNLTPASRRQDHTTSPYASCAIRQRRIRVHRIPSRACDDRETPLVPGWDENRHTADLGLPSSTISENQKLYHGGAGRAGLCDGLPDAPEGRLGCRGRQHQNWEKSLGVNVRSSAFHSP
jgi:hypothetical protein